MSSGPLTRAVAFPTFFLDNRGMALIVFLRGVNVGGHRTFRPSILARELSDYDVVNVGAAGTFVVRKPSGAKFRSALLHDALLGARAGAHPVAGKAVRLEPELRVPPSWPTIQRDAVERTLSYRYRQWPSCGIGALIRFITRVTSWVRVMSCLCLNVRRSEIHLAQGVALRLWNRPPVNSRAY